MKPTLYFFIVFIFVLTGCLSEKRIERKYYTIELPVEGMPIRIDSVSQIKADCEIEQVVINEVYGSNQIVNRVRSNEISYYIYNKWAINPADAITQALIEYFEVKGIFQNISGGFSKSKPDLRFWTYIYSMESIEMDRSFSAHLALEFRLIDNSSNKVIMSHKADRTDTLDQKDLNLFAGEISKIIQQELNIFTGMISDKKDLIYGRSDKN